VQAESQARVAFRQSYPAEAGSAEFATLEARLLPYIDIMQKLAEGMDEGPAQTVPLVAPYGVLVAVYPEMSSTLECQMFFVQATTLVATARKGTDPRTARSLLENVEEAYLTLKQTFPVEVESPEFFTLGAVLLPHINALEQVAKQTAAPTAAEVLAQMLDPVVQHPVRQPPDGSASPEIQVKRYKDEREYGREARRMLAEGWRIEGQSSQRGNVKMGSTMLKAGVFLPWAVMRPSRKGDPITVTWLRGG
jgi:hypothetical protein